MKSKGIILTICFLYLIGFNSCKKLTKADPVYIGEWVSEQGYYQFFLSINSGSQGKYWTIGQNSVNSSQHPYSGKARIDLSSKHIYLGITKFKIIHHPHMYTTNSDSIPIFGTWHRTTGIKMTLENSVLHGNVTIDFFKLAD